MSECHEHTCETPNCGKQAKLRCPTCLKLSLPHCYFCSQECFKGNWDNHKAVHKSSSNSTAKDLDIYPGFHYTGLLRAYPQSPKRSVPASIGRPDYADHPNGESLEEQSARHSSAIRVLNDGEIEGMRVASKLGREVLDVAARAIGVGVTTDEIDRLVHEACIERDCYPSPLGYYGFPKSVCTSVNEVICHGIPDLRPLENGDLCNVDVTVYHRGFHGDLNETFFVGEVDEKSRLVTKCAYECLMAGINIVRPGVKVREIGNEIQKVANSMGCSVVRSFCGHGINNLFHTAPSVPHYSRNKAIGVMRAGQTFTIEPMINLGSYGDCQWPDHWTAVTSDGQRSAQFEQTLLVTDSGCDILTVRRERNGQPWFMDGL